MSAINRFVTKKNDDELLSLINNDNNKKKERHSYIVDDTVQMGLFMRKRIHITTDVSIIN